ncbi:ribosomal protein L24, putative [Trichomonas vaginalis G3]|uniref:Ribosomal protein L24, putative n=1 Tax=Trichomonas vaginalis (strain ATCC PRA-98 / G3) TaxID=412133 RepID=A2DCS2_TRIV3|nr:regulation of translation involved in cellular response to UV [Trichomonas vaginalis G3]XP_001308290.1 regulation of translation involved in cellular response to UV [Trichomonas vaginalis G3]XP_001326922.1 regulation of translation involved in cellular response to UV [Trichomonas vaginalis G3]XP_001582682.1 regulation of translation involved in cellular response to UV [Trichomonas vaginalis G3]EAX90378.1 ribosomal protein L24, putative [Trichomonas vaginalis G3]EAX95360.1 ribosomal protein |eukprot:XP_001303308.1 ribosomal protein L24 [Trichomonas vaginalis G3]
MVKTNPFLSSQAKKTRKAFFNATKDDKHRQLSAKLNKEQAETHGVKQLPIRRDDEVSINSGKFAGREGKVIAVKLSENRIVVDSFTREKLNGQTVHVSVHPSNCLITKLKMDKQRKELIERRRAGREKILAKLGHNKK